ncbi:probable starch synthase 4, chloroplastic/amyloplastic [Malania oleifera]|uniref:probable starch synthase 4, chloroplastic/amyloplastic n=1 Tax=Malania oleifera TaxID=397392 RepID=UPI0025ADB94F|nr:probable starch synthase 4, chloroplastic/amyloplastic [Malania oleifera]
MLMGTLLSAAITPLPPLSVVNAASHKPTKAPAVRCSRLSGHDNVKMSQSSSSEQEIKHNDIWKLFKEAQQNILYLNNQRLMAVEELNEAKREKQLLLDRIEHLEAVKQPSVGKDNLSVGWDLLLRIDSMVLTGMIGTGEASNVRRLIMDSKINVADVLPNIWQKGDAELLTELRHFTDKSKKNCFHIVHICTEMAPVASFGSLASYITGLSCALQRKGNFVEVILPKYSKLDLDKVQGLREIDAEFYSYYNGQLHGNRIWTGVVHGIGVTLLQPLYYSSFFSRERIYGYSDDFERFTYFSRASLDYIVKSGKQPDVLHIHNWQTAIVGPLFWDIFVKQGLGNTRVLLTCHGFDIQCIEQPDKLALCGLDPSRLHRPDRLQDNTKTHLVNILKGGVVYSNKVVIMSFMHSKGRFIRSLNHGLEPTLAIHKDKLLIAPNGFDDSTWDPSKDKFLPAIYTADDMKGKAICKVALQRHLGLPEHASTVLVGCVLSEVSDVDLEKLKAAVLIAYRRGIQFIFMGSSKMPSINRALESCQEELKDESARFIKKYDEVLSHLIFAGSDIILCPSFHDPVLQVLLKAIKYGAVPIAVMYNDNRLGHSGDREFDSTKVLHYIGSTFANMSLSQALDEMKNNPLQWSQRILDAMEKDFSWDAECSEIHIDAYAFLKDL